LVVIFPALIHLVKRGRENSGKHFGRTSGN